MAAEDYVLKLHLDSLRRVQRSISDVCTGVDERSGGVYAIFFFNPLSQPSQRIFLAGEGGKEDSVMIYICPWDRDCIGPTGIQIQGGRGAGAIHGRLSELSRASRSQAWCTESNKVPVVGGGGVLKHQTEKQAGAQS